MIPQKMQVPARFTRRRVTVILFSFFTWFFFTHLPSPPVTQNNTRADRPPPKYRVEEKPHFLYRSPFRQSPDYQYEKELSNALMKIEQSVLDENQGNSTSESSIWQVAISQTVEEKELRGADSRAFEETNSEWTYNLVGYEKALHFVTTELSVVPEIAAAFESYPQNVLQADFLRYLLLWYYGGFYADLDVFPARSIRTCPTLQPFFASSNDRTQNTNSNVSLVVGIEVDEPYATSQFMRDWHWSRSYGFIQYTMFAPRRFSPLLRETIVHVLSHTRQHIKNHSSFFRSASYDEKAILGVTGPDVFTDALLETLSSSLPLTHPLIQQSLAADSEIGDLVVRTTGEIDYRVSWAPFHRIRDPVCVHDNEAAHGKSMGGLCVLPINVWGNGQRHSRAGGFNDVNACVNHRFGRTWKKGWWEYIFG